MLCHLCDTFLSNVLERDLTTWKRVEKGWFTFKHGDYATVTAAADAGCELCALFNQVRKKFMVDYDNLNPKWHTHAASIDVRHEYDYVRADVAEDDSYSKWTFQLLTVAPEMSWIPFETFKPDDDRTTGEGSNWPLAVSTTPDSRKTIDLAKSWTNCCMEEHSSCSRPDRTPLPTRIIDLGYSDDVPSPRLQVNRGQSGRYVTLSHCWGVGSRLTLTKRNIRTFQQAIPFNQLPKTFQDAVKLTMLLGIRYLWIDALCIIQDDENDWKREAASMYSVFENALFSISALASTDCHSGMLHERATPHIFAEVGGTRIGVRQKLDGLREALRKSTLETRAWCFQERLLPLAILHVGSGQFYWQCFHSFSESTREEKTDGHIVSRRKSGTGKTECLEDANKDWLRLVIEYSARKVTRASDRLPAIAGLADKARRDLGYATYMQGLWGNNLHAGLLWRRQRLMHGRAIPSRDRYPSHTSLESAERPLRPIASTWSWAAINDAVEYLMHEQYPFRCPSSYDAEFKDDYHHSTTSLPLEGLVKRGSCKLTPQTSHEHHEAVFRPSGSLLVDDGLTCYLDYINDPVSRSCYCLQIARWQQPVAPRAGKKTQTDATRVFYLLLERIELDGPSVRGTDSTDFGSFKRIGMGFDATAKVDKMFANAERRHMRLL